MFVYLPIHIDSFNNIFNANLGVCVGLFVYWFVHNQSNVYVYTRVYQLAQVHSCQVCKKKKKKKEINFMKKEEEFEEGQIR